MRLTKAQLALLETFLDGPGDGPTAEITEAGRAVLAPGKAT